MYMSSYGYEWFTPVSVESIEEGLKNLGEELHRRKMPPAVRYQHLDHERSHAKACPEAVAGFGIIADQEGYRCCVVYREDVTAEQKERCLFGAIYSEIGLSGPDKEDLVRVCGFDRARRLLEAAYRV